ncbi:MAG: RagB/SusD family nutrient uptake outer membrane protein [Bacteroidales bacterium]|nr:RagB/SusD family nutrient uptake outer membrane protein [Bacteroidales bacterium]
MKRIFIPLAILVFGAMATSCNEQLDASSPAVVDANFVFGSLTTARSVMLGAYNQYQSSGFFPNIDVNHNDVERANLGFVADQFGAGQLYGGKVSYTVENFNINAGHIKGKWDKYYKIIALCNQVIDNIEAFEDIDEIRSTAPNDWSDMLGQAYCLRASCYYDMARWFGDVIYIDKSYQITNELTNRDYIIEKEMAHVIAAEPLMYYRGQNNHFSDQMTKNYAEGLIARMCFMEAGYQTRRTDLGADFYTDGEGKPLSFDVWGTDDSRAAQYARRSDWKDFYVKSIPWLKKEVYETPGSILTVVDPRSDSENRTYGNPFQWYFEQINDLIMAKETIYEQTYAEYTGGSRVAYDLGRACSGGGTGYPPKANAGACVYPLTFYDLFDPEDMRRDVSMTVTASNGKGQEIINNYNLSNRQTGGVQMNKYDVNRQENPSAVNTQAGMNRVMMRKADLILMLAEAYARTGDEASAAIELRKVHNRAFADDIEDQKYNELLASVGGDMVEAILKERMLEFVDEGLRRWDLVRTGQFPQVAVEFRARLVREMEEIKANGYIQYDNGNQFPNYIWTKTVNGREVLGYRLTMQTPPGTDPDTEKGALLIPGWRGQHDDWGKVAEEDGYDLTRLKLDDSNLAIRGLFRYIDPDSAEAKALEAQGYKKTEWGIGMYTVNGKYDPDREFLWSASFMCGYTDADYAAKKAPIYMNPYEASVCATTGLKNGYGFKSSMD